MILHEGDFRNHQLKMGILFLTGILFGFACAYYDSISIFLFSLTAVFFSASFIFAMWDVNILKRKLFVKDKMLSQMENELRAFEMGELLNELKPHFVINTLSAIIPLIDSDSEKSKTFIYEFTKVLKYFQQNTRRRLIPLEEELIFIESYFHLLQVRFGKSIRLIKSKHVYDDNICIPPFALQVAIENAVKHNYFNEKNTLDISITRHNDYLVISNNTRLKPVGNSTATGLKNLTERYRLLYEEEPRVYKTEQEFYVWLPLIKTSEYDSRNYNRRRGKFL